MLFWGVPISSSQAGLCAETQVVQRSTKIVHGGMDCAQGHGLCTEARVVHRSTRLCPETQGFVSRDTGVCAQRHRLCIEAPDCVQRHRDLCAEAWREFV